MADPEIALLREHDPEIALLRQRKQPERACDRLAWCMQGYIHHIRRAERYVYIENQFFAGSCFMWKSQQNCGCSHSVVAELVAKLVTKIKAGQDFTAYVVQPLFPGATSAGWLRFSLSRN